MTELGRLIRTAARANHGRSMQTAADLATSRGHMISKSHISKNSRSVESVTPQLIRGIAAGYDLPEEDVARAALADMGFTITDYRVTPESAIRRDPDLSAEARAILLSAIGAARLSDGHRGRDELQHYPGAQWDTGDEPGVGGGQERDERRQLGG